MPTACESPDMPNVSIVIPTYNRMDRLTDTLSRIRDNVSLSHEIIVVDGGSTDGTREFLADARELRVILEPEREGAVRAFNRGFRAAVGRYVMWLNDDAWPLPGAVEAAAAFVERYDDVGMVAFYHDWDRERNVLDSVERDGRRYSVYSVRGYPYANFGLLRRTLLERIGFADERYYFFAFDPDLALKIQLEAGLKVVGCRDALVHHEEYHDDRKWADLSIGQDDNAKLFAKWNLPAPGTYPAPAPAYQAMVREMTAVARPDHCHP